MSKRDMPWPEIGARVEVTWIGVDEGWDSWTFHGSRNGWVCLMPSEMQGQRHLNVGRLHWFPIGAVDCMAEVGDE